MIRRQLGGRAIMATKMPMEINTPSGRNSSAMTTGKYYGETKV
jgi:hypothetical protein